MTRRFTGETIDTIVSMRNGGEGFDMRTAVATAVGCPYGAIAEQAIQADAHYADSGNEDISDPDELTAKRETAAEADEDANDMAAALLNCKTCLGDPAKVDLKDGEVCEYALLASMSSVITPRAVREYRKSVGK